MSPLLLVLNRYNILDLTSHGGRFKFSAPTRSTLKPENLKYKYIFTYPTNAQGSKTKMVDCDLYLEQMFYYNETLKAILAAASKRETSRSARTSRAI